MISRDNQVIVPGVMRVGAKILADEAVALLLDVANPFLGFCFGRLVLKFVGIVDPGIEGGGDADSETFFFWENQIGAAT